MYKALTYVHLPVVEKTFAPGDVISVEEWEAAGQTDEDAQNLLDNGSLSTDPDAELHKDHLPVDVTAPSLESMVSNAKQLADELGDSAPDELKAFANADYSHVIAGDNGQGASDVGS